MSKKYSKLSIAGFALIILSVIIGQFFIFNDAMIRFLGRDVFDAVFNPLLICLFATHIAGIVLSIIGLINAFRKKLKGKGFSIAGIVFFLIEGVVIVFSLGLLLMVMFGDEKRPPDYVQTEITETMSDDLGFYEDNMFIVYLKNAINEDMSLFEIIDAFEQMHNVMGDQDLIVFSAGPNDFSVYDCYAGEYVDAGYYYGFCLKRWFTASDGKRYQLCVNVMYKPGDEDYQYKDDAMSIDVDGNVNEDFFDDIRNSDAYKYASSREIDHIDIFMGPQQ